MIDIHSFQMFPLKAMNNESKPEAKKEMSE